MKAFRDKELVRTKITINHQIVQQMSYLMCGIIMSITEYILGQVSSKWSVEKSIALLETRCVERHILLDSFYF